MAGFNSAPAMMFNNPNNIQIFHRAQFQNSFNNCCLGEMGKRRMYAYVMENRYEANYPCPCVGPLTCDDKCARKLIQRSRKVVSTIARCSFSRA